MTRFAVLALILGIALFSRTTVLWAHHGAQVAFDTTKEVTWRGVVTSVKWENPHTWIYVDVKDENGNVVNWGLESTPPTMLARNGTTPDILKPGVEVVIKGNPGWDASKHFGRAGQITFPGRSSTVAGGDNR